MLDPAFYSPQKSLSWPEIRGILGIYGDLPPEGPLLRGVESLSEADSSEATYAFRPKYKEDLKETHAGLVIVSPEMREFVPGSTIALVTERPLAAFNALVQAFYGSINRDTCSTFIDSTAQIDPTAMVCPGAIVGPGVTIGAQTLVGPGASLLYCHVGPHCRIGPGVRIGQIGFGFEWEKGTFQDVPQLGTVKIGSHVRIGANTCIDRGTFGDTVIGNYIFIDNLVHIAHNVKIGDGSIIVAQVGISGSTTLGKGVVAAGQVGITGHLSIGDRVTIAAQSGVMRDIAPGETVGGSPALEIKLWRRLQVKLMQWAREKK